MSFCETDGENNSVGVYLNDVFEDVIVEVENDPVAILALLAVMM